MSRHLYIYETTSLHIRSTCIHLTWQLNASNHQIINPKAKTLATSTNRLCALHSHTYDSPSQRQQNPSSHVSDARPSLFSHRHHKNRTLHPPIPIQSLGFTKGACGYSVSALHQWCLRTALRTRLGKKKGGQMKCSGHRQDSSH